MNDSHVREMGFTSCYHTHIITIENLYILLIVLTFISIVVSLISGMRKTPIVPFLKCSAESLAIISLIICIFGFAAEFSFKIHDVLFNLGTQEPGEARKSIVFINLSRQFSLFAWTALVVEFGLVVIYILSRRKKMSM